MKKVLNINIGKTVFIIEEDAYNQLNIYLKTLNLHFSKNISAKEIIEDIELSIAEKFTTCLKKQNNSAVSLSNIEKIILDLGTPDNIEDLEDIKDVESKVVRKLYRNSDDIILAGVSSGIAYYLQDVTNNLKFDTGLVRFLFIFLTFFSGIGFIIYLTLWVIVPFAKTQEEKLAMQGKAPTVKFFKKYAEKKLDEVPSQTKNFFPQLFRFIVKIVKISVGVILWFFFQILILTVSLIFLLLISNITGDITFQMDSITGQIFADFIVNRNLWIPFIGLYFVLLIPLLFGVRLGGVLLFNSKLFNWSIIGILLFIWVLFLSYISFYFVIQENDFQEIKSRYELAIEKNPDYSFYIYSEKNK